MNLKKDYKKFLAKDTTQTFAAVSLLFTILLLSGQIDTATYNEVMKWNIAGFYGSELTNFRGLG